MEKEIVKRTYSILDGKPSSKVMYLASGFSAIGQETWHEDVNEAHRFKTGESGYHNQTAAGNDRYGDFSYKQQIVTIINVYKIKE